MKKFSAKLDYDLGYQSYTTIIRQKSSGATLRFVMEESVGSKAGKFLKASDFSSLSTATRNRERKLTGIVTFNIPEERIAYKCIYDASLHRISDQPVKIFSSNKEGKWVAVDSPSPELIGRFEIERERLIDCSWTNRGR